MSQSERKVKINSTHDLPVKHQCQLLSISRSSAYYQSKAPCDEELGLMRHLDALHLRYPFYGARRLRDALLDEEVYLHAYESLIQARNGLEKYFKFYNTKRKHQTLKAKPNEVYYKNLPTLQKAA